MIDTVNKEQCCGCSACANICPQKAISMQIDEEGFYYPIIDCQKCVRCNLCESVCLACLKKNNDKKDREPVAYAAKANDDETRKYSSSGGVFSVLSELVLSENGIVYGVSMSDDFSRAHHIRISEAEQLKKIRGSKYLYSLNETVFVDVRNDLEMGKKVLFSGTPCQVCGLKFFLNKEYNNLLCVDVICHGIPSYLIWEEYLSDIKNILRKPIKSLSFRSKKESWQSFGQEIKAEKKALFYSKEEDVFLRLFLSDCCLRSSCYNCFVKENGVYLSDITLGDFWSINRVDKSFNDGKGVSLIVSRSNKGDAILRKVKNGLMLKEEDYFSSIRGNSIIEQTAKPVGRNTFFDDLERMPIKVAANKYAPMSLREKIKSILRRLNLYKPTWRANYGMEFIKSE